jgi:hypothetical protein
MFPRDHQRPRGAAFRNEVGGAPLLREGSHRARWKRAGMMRRGSGTRHGLASEGEEVRGRARRSRRPLASGSCRL